MTSPSSRRADVVQGPQHAATGPEPSSGVGPALHLGEPEPPLRSYPELGVLPSAVPAPGCMPGTRCGSGTLTRVRQHRRNSANTEYPTLRKREDAHWDRYPTPEPAGKVLWCEIEALSPRGAGGGVGGNHRSFG
jgi:hypothetical protein